MLETLLHLKLALGVISADHINLKIRLQTMLETHISSHIVTNIMLLRLLDDISVKTIGLLFPSKPELLGLPRAAIPLRGDLTNTFDVLGMDSLPYPIPHTDALMLQYTSKHYLVISEPRTHYFLINSFNVYMKYDSLLIWYRVISPILPFVLGRFASGRSVGRFVRYRI